jgi:hypothetical protein
MGGLLSLVGWVVIGLGVVVLFRRLPQFGLTTRGHALALIAVGLFVAGFGARIPDSAGQGGPSNGDTSQAIALTPTAAPTPTPTPTPTATPAPTPTPTPAPTLKHLVVVATPKPTVRVTSAPAPPPAAFNYCGAPANPWHYNFCGGSTIDPPPSSFCSYFACIASFWTEDIPNDGYVIQCVDGRYSDSGGEAGGVCSSHGGPSRTLYAP